jgi:CubicO group peptidase (beta-lactamase class C family)
MKIKRFTALLPALLLLVLTTTYCAPSKERLAKEEMERVMEKNSAVGLAVAVVKGGEIIYTGSFGYKNLEDSTLLSDGDLFRIASISKSFTTTALLTLLEGGLLSLDQDVSELTGFVVRNPAFPDVVITVKMLLSHTSSLNDTQGYFNLDILNPEKNKEYAKCYNEYEPGTKYQYCNLGFNTLGAIAERLAGERFDQFTRHKLLAPLGLYASFNPDSLDRTKYVTLYDSIAQPAAYVSRAKQLDSGYVMGYSTPLFSPTGGMKISATDLAKYMVMHMNYGALPNGERIISEETSRLMQSAVVETGEGESYGLALRQTDNFIPGERMIGHTGSAYGLYSAMFFEPEKKFGIVLMTNGCKPVYEGGFVTIQTDVARALYNIFIKE